MHLLRGGKPQHLAAVVGLEHLIALRCKIDPQCGHDVPLVITNQNPIHAVLPHFSLRAAACVLASAPTVYRKTAAETSRQNRKIFLRSL